MTTRPLPGLLLAAWAAACATTMDADAASKSPDLTCRMSVPARVTKGAAVTLTFEIANRGKAAMNVLNWNTPLEGFFGKYLEVTGPDGEVEYAGAMVKRGGVPVREDYLSIKPGTRLTRSVNLGKAYALAKPGKYQVAFTGKLLDATSQKIPRALIDGNVLELDCAPVAFEVTAR